MATYLDVLREAGKTDGKARRGDDGLSDLAREYLEG